jgi:hypothetical protein
MNGNTVLILKRIRYVLEHNDEFPNVDSGQIGFDLHNMVRKYLNVETANFFTALFGVRLG